MAKQPVKILHEVLPQTLTPENLAVWLTENNIDKRIHSQELKLSEEDVHLYENKIANVTQQIYRLQEVKAEFEAYLKKGTSVTHDAQGQPQYQPQTVTIPPTKGLNELEENRKYYAKILEQGFRNNDFEVFGIPYPKGETVLFFNSEGQLIFDEPMNEAQIAQFGKGLFD